MKIKLLAILAFAFILSSCTDENEVKPKNTQSFNNSWPLAK
ncbi:MAG: hypothetical protein ACOVO2_22125 [Emticicia sp.]